MSRLGLILAATLAGLAAGEQRRGEEALAMGDIEMLDCAPVSTRPCFRATVRFGAAVPAAESLLMSSTSVELDGLPAKLFHVSTQERGAGGRKPRTVMVVFDISGSMNTKMSNGVSRYEVAKLAVDRFLSSLDPDTDQVAIVPFDNHGVLATIRAARFVPGGEEARALLAAIPAPRGDTALYAAIYYSIERLEQQKRLDAARDYQAIVITDGKDDLGRDPDPELRRAPITLEGAALKAERSNVAVYPIGIGGAGDTDILAPLERISIENSHMVQEPGELMEVVARARPAPATRMQIAFLSPYATAGQLEGRSHRVRVVIGKGGQRVETTGEWAPPESMIAPQARADCSAAEKQALSKMGPPADDYTALIRPLATLGVFACIVALCWFAMPRLIWPENYGPGPARMERAAPPSAKSGGDARGAAVGAGNIRQDTEKTYVLPREQADPKSRFR